MSRCASFIYYFTLFFCFSLVICSCSSENSITSSFSSRKYTKGHFNNSPASIGKVAVSETRPVNIPAIEPVKTGIVKQNIAPENIAVSPVVASIQIQQKVVTPQQKSKNDLTYMVKSLKLNVSDTVNDSLDDGYAKEKRTNRILGVVGFASAVAGAVFLILTDFYIAAALIVIGFIISAIGIRRGSNSLFAFFGFVISILGIIALLDIIIVAQQG